MSQVPDENSTERAMAQSAVEEMLANLVRDMTVAGDDEKRQLEFVRDTIISQLEPRAVELIRTLCREINALGDEGAKKEAWNCVLDRFAEVADEERTNASMAPETSIPAGCSVIGRDEDHTGAPDQQILGKDSEQG